MPNYKSVYLAPVLAAVFGASAFAQDFAAPFEAELEAQSEAPAQAIEQAALPAAPLWQNAETSVVHSLVARTNPEILPPTARSILIELLHGSNQPEGADDKYLATRLAHLGNLGALEAIASISAGGLKGGSGAEMAESYIGAKLLNSGLDDACESQAKLPPSIKQGAHWARLEAVCFTRAGQAIQADFALEIVAEAVTPDPLFDTLYAALSNNAKTVEALPPPPAGHAFSTALHLAMISAIGLDPAVIGVTPDQALTRPILIDAEGAPLETRIFAAEKALMAGQISKEKLGALYRTAYDQMRAETEIALPGAIQDAALHYNIIATPELGLESTPAIAAAFREAQQRETLPAIAHLYAQAAAAQQADTASEDDAAIIARGLLSIGAFNDAKPWFMVSYTAASNNSPGAFERLNSIWPLIGMANGSTAPRGIEKLAAGWLTTQDVSKDDAARRRAVLLFTLLEGFGRPVEETLWLPLLPNNGAKPYHVVDHTLWRGMEAAAARGERGMALSLLLNALSQAAIQDHHPAFLASAVNTLVTIGMGADGHALAVDALLAAGF